MYLYDDRSDGMHSIADRYPIGDFRETRGTTISLKVWASASDVPLLVCRDARLRDRGASSLWRSTLSQTDKIYGQTGWDIGLNFSDLSDLANQLNRIHVPEYVSGGGNLIRRGELSRLAINAHGVPGAVYVNGRNRPTKSLNARTARVMHKTDLRRIGLLTRNDGTSVILLMGCIAGRGQDGTDLLLALSREWPDRRIVAFATIGFAIGGAMKRPGENCTEPGMRLTRSPHPSLTPRLEREYEMIWNNLGQLPWASETSPFAKVALNGRIIRGNNL